MKIGILGTGNVGRALAAGWATAGHDVVLGSRRPDDRELRALAEKVLLDVSVGFTEDGALYRRRTAHGRA
ncbi:NAD(P)-binding domain-containing protein [Nonomuraea sp. NPDC049695]|uniref:NAD(P)-binding domain-containing protein n=1 Tax=Nonomuraea sp. NPDC049695 TaxID=3154734 RepID=UPI00343D214C